MGKLSPEEITAHRDRDINKKYGDDVEVIEGDNGCCVVYLVSDPATGGDVSVHYEKRSTLPTWSMLHNTCDERNEFVENWVNQKNDREYFRVPTQRERLIEVDNIIASPGSSQDSELRYFRVVELYEKVGIKVVELEVLPAERPGFFVPGEPLGQTEYQGQSINGSVKIDYRLGDESINRNGWRKDKTLFVGELIWKPDECIARNREAAAETAKAG